MFTVLRALTDATPERLTTLLKAAELLGDRRVSAVRTQVTDAFNSTVAHLELDYSGGDEERGAAGPPALVLKLNQQGAGQEEVAFYQLAAQSGTDVSMLVPCISAVFDPESGASHLLLLDVSATHEAAVGRTALLNLAGVLPETRMSSVTEALARFHAAWWNHPLLDKHPATRLTQRYRDELAFEAWWEKHRYDYEAFIKTYGKSVSGELEALYENALEHYPKLWTRFIEPRRRKMSGLTLAHNDCYLVQFLYPKSDRGPIYLVDFQTVCTDFAARDLVYLMATFWTREQRRRYERGVLEHYHRVLTESGVSGYSLDALFDDYRLMLIDMVFHPVWDTTYGADPAYWQPKLTCLTDAYRDWQCDVLFA